jgi:hypothetical protein
MIRPLMTVVLSGILGSMVLVGNAEACHKRKCGCAKPVACQAAPAPCVKPVAYCRPAPCPKPVATKCCTPRVKTCKLTLPKLCFKKKCAPPPVIVCASPAYCAVAPAGYPVPSSQASPQH